MSRKKRSSLSGSIAVLLAAVMLIAGGTFAYLRHSSDEIVNAFSPNQVKVELTESGDQKYNIIPGTTEDKDPTVTVDSTVPAYVFVEVNDTTAGLVTYHFAEGWNVLGDEYPNVLFREYGASEDEKNVFPVLQDNQVSYSWELTNTQMADQENLELSFKALAVQKSGFKNALDAYEKITAFEVTDENGKIVAYNINNKEQLYKISEMINSGDAPLNSTINIMSDIDLRGASWTPIGNDQQTKFCGTVNGNGRTIKNFTVESEVAGFIGAAAGDCKVSGLTIENAAFKSISENSGSAFAGGVIAAYQGGNAEGLVSDCQVVDSTVHAFTNKAKGNSAKAGGIVGHVSNDAFANGPIVENCTIRNVAVTGGDKVYVDRGCTGEIIGFLGSEISTENIGRNNSLIEVSVVRLDNAGNIVQ